MRNESNVPIPPKKARSGYSRAILESMKPLESRVVNKREAHTLRLMAYTLKIEIVQRLLPDGRIRIWKI